MIPSIDTYLYDEIESKLKIILANRYIIEEILSDIQPDVAENFIDTYTGDKGRDIPITYTLPQEKAMLQGSIYVALREGTESRPSIGNLEDIYAYKETGINKDKSLVQVTDDGSKLFLEVNNPIGELVNVENLSFSASDKVSTEGNRVYFTKEQNESLLDHEFNVNYIGTSNKNTQGLKKGFTSTEQYTIVALSTNMDIVRCIDLLLKAIFIMMRDNPEELNNHLLQNLQFGQIEELDVGKTDGSPSGKAPELLYGRETIVTYTVSYSLDDPILQKLKDILVNTELDLRRE